MKYFIITLAITLLCYCSSSPSEGNRTSENEIVSKTNNSSESSCLAEITDPAQWYSTPELASLVEEEEESINFKSNPQYDNCNFRWENERKHIMKVSSIEMEVPTNNTVGITIYNLDEKIERAEKMHRKEFTYEEYFDSYHTTTKKGEEAVKDALEEKGKEDENAKKAKGLLDMAPTEGHADVEGIGDKANKYVQTAPGLREIRLSILHGNVVIMVNADVSDDDEKDLEVAKTVALSVLALCD